MANYVLVPGFWIGGWAWEKVTTALRADGHTVFPITLTGVGERVHLASPQVTLETHVDDVVNTIEYADLHDVILVGHSGGGMVVTGAAHRIPERIARLVYVESGPLPEGMSQADTEGEGVREQRLKRLADDPVDGWRYPLPSWEDLGGPGGMFTAGLGPEERALMESRAVPHPVRAVTDPPVLSAPEAVDKIPHVLVTSAFPLAQVEAMRAENHPFFSGFAGKEWEILEVPTGHWPMLSKPVELATALEGLA